ncbi:hypothetical protein LXJ15735_28850 [Lacrimispora xylanolytica]
MGSFGIGINVKDIDSGQIKGKIHDIACKTWFTSNCNPIPLSFKYEAEDGTIQSVVKLTVKTTEDKRYAGVATKEYKCEAIIEGKCHNFKLIFYLEVCKWILVL